MRACSHGVNAGPAFGFLVMPSAQAIPIANERACEIEVKK
jgi:hypothetical protein